MSEAEVERVGLESWLAHLSRVLTRTEELGNQYQRLQAQYQPQQRPLIEQWGAKNLLIAVGTGVIAYMFANSNLILFLYISLGIAAVAAAAGIFLLIKGGAAHPGGLFFIVDAAVIALLVIFAARIIGPLATVWLVVAAVAAIGYLVGWCRDMLVPGRNRRINLENEAAADDATRALEQAVAPLLQEVWSMNQSFQERNYPLHLPDKYLNPATATSLYQIVHSLRADTLKEALNVYVQDLHNQYMRDAANQQVALQRMQLEEQQRTTRSTQIAAVANVAMQAYQGAATRGAMRDGSQRISDAIRDPHNNRPTF